MKATDPAEWWMPALVCFLFGIAMFTMIGSKCMPHQQYWEAALAGVAGMGLFGGAVFFAKKALRR